MLPHQRTLQTTVTNQNMASTQVNQKQLIVDNSTIIVKEHLDSVKKTVAQLLDVMRHWRNKFNFGNTKLHQQNMWHKYKKTNTVPVDQLNKFFSRTDLPNLEWTNKKTSPPYQTWSLQRPFFLIEIKKIIGRGRRKKRNDFKHLAKW